MGRFFEIISIIGLSYAFEQWAGWHVDLDSHFKQLCLNTYSRPFNKGKDKIKPKFVKKKILTFWDISWVLLL